MTLVFALLFIYLAWVDYRATGGFRPFAKRR